MYNNYIRQMGIYTNTYRLINGIIYNSYMVCFTVNLEVMSREREPKVMELLDGGKKFKENIQCQ